MMRNIILVCALTSILSSCGLFNSGKSSSISGDVKKAATEVIGCQAIATVRDHTYNQSCQFLLELEDGTVLLPASTPITDAPFYEGAGVKIGYEIIEDEKNIVEGLACDKHDKVATINCIEPFIFREEGTPANFDECKSIKNPYKFEWIRRELNIEKPKLINEYSYTIGYIYEFQSEQASVLYDCLGNRMCSTEDGMDCVSLLETLKNPKVILVINN